MGELKYAWAEMAGVDAAAVQASPFTNADEGSFVRIDIVYGGEGATASCCRAPHGDRQDSVAGASADAEA